MLSWKAEQDPTTYVRTRFQSQYHQIVCPRVVLKYLSILEKTRIFHPTSVFKLLALRVFWVAAFGKEDESAMAKLHDNVLVWFDGFASIVLLRFPRTLKQWRRETESLRNKFTPWAV